MVRIGLQLKATLENLSNFRPEGNSFRWYLKLRCANCGELTPKWVYVSLLEKTPIKGSRGNAHLVTKCKLCSRDNTLGILEDSLTTYTAADSGQFKTVVVFECRGVEPVDFEPRTGFCAVGVTSGTLFSDVDLTQKDWSDYDENARQPVSILEVEHKFIKM